MRPLLVSKRTRKTSGARRVISRASGLRRSDVLGPGPRCCWWGRKSAHASRATLRALKPDGMNKDSLLPNRQNHIDRSMGLDRGIGPIVTGAIKTASGLRDTTDFNRVVRQFQPKKRRLSGFFLSIRPRELARPN